MIRLENVCKNFGDLQVLKNVNLEVKEGEKLVIIGPSGSGKSTTVRCMNFLEEPTSGQVYIDGQKLTHANKTKIIRESISMVFQQFNLYPHMTVLKNHSTHEAASQEQKGSRGSGLSLSGCGRT
jgi:putative glutamine transport system ATP-binding protein